MSGLDAQALAFLSEQAVKAGREAVLAPSQEPPGVYYMLDRVGDYQRKETPPPQERRQFANLDSLTDWAWPLPSPRAWVSLIEVRATVEDARQSFGVMPVGHSPQLTQLLAMERAHQDLEQPQVIRLLRNTLAGCLPSTTVSIFRNLRFTKNETGGGNLQHDRASLGRALEAQVTGTEAIPETIDLDVPMVADPFVPVGRQRVKLIVEVDHVAQRFRLIPYPGDLVIAIRSCELELYNRVVDAVVRNRPGTGQEAIENDVKRASAVKEFRVYSGKASV